MANLYGFTVRDMPGNDGSLRDYAGKVRTAAKAERAT